MDVECSKLKMVSKLRYSRDRCSKICHNSNVSCYLTSCTHTCNTPPQRTHARATALSNTFHVSPTRANTSITSPDSHVRIRTFGIMYYTHAFHAMCATTQLSLTHLHHAPSGACAQLSYPYTVMWEMNLTPPLK